MAVDLWELSDLSTPWCVHVAATLRVADHIAAGKTGIVDLAAAVKADPESLGRVLRQLVGKGVFEEPSPGVFTLNDAARGLLDERIRISLDLEAFGGRMAHAWGTLLTAVRTGKPAYHEVFGRQYWDDLDDHPDIAASFDSMMGPLGHGTPDPEVLTNAEDWQTVNTVADIGGGTGSLLAEVLRAHPHVRGTLVDLPRTVARSGEILAAAGVADRVTVAGQSFFDPLPAGCDVYLLSRVLVDWPDTEAQAILRRCAEAAGKNGRVMLLDGVTPEERASPELLMLVLVGGKQRTLREFRDLAHAAGLTVTAAAQQPSGRLLVECRAA